MMGVALYLVWRTGTEKAQVKAALAIFALQLVLNVLWSFLFFGFHQPYWAFIEIILLWLAILATIKVFYPISKAAAWLLVPYLVWVTFASLLTYAIWQLN